MTKIKKMKLEIFSLMIWHSNIKNLTIIFFTFSHLMKYIKRKKKLIF